MSQIKYRGNLSSASYSFDIEDAGRTVIVPQQDQNWSRQVQSSADPDKDIGIPQIMYLRNVLPTDRGYRSIGGTEGSLVSGFSGFASIHSTGYVAGEQVNLIMNTGYIACVGSKTSGAFNIAASLTGSTTRELLCYELNGSIYTMMKSGEPGQADKYYKVKSPQDFFNVLPAAESKTFPLAGIDGSTSISQLCVVGNRLIFLVHKPNGEQIIAWSSSVDPDDFDFSRGSLTGAGYITPQHVKSPIVKIVPHVMGAIIYTKTECVAMVFQMGDAINPFTFRPIGGVIPGESFNVLGDYKSPYHYYISRDKCLRIAFSGAESTFPVLDSALRERKFVTSNSSMGLTIHSHDTGLPPTINKVCDRYLVVCFTSAAKNVAMCFIYDELLKRWGQVEILNDFMGGEQIYSAMAMPGVTDNNFELRCFTTVSGIYKIRRFRIYFSQVTTPIQESINSLAIFGKFQHVRGHLLSIQHIELENKLTGTPTVKLISTMDGKNPSVVTQPYNADTGKIIHRLADQVGLNHCIAVEGTFDLNTIQLSFNDEGRTTGVDYAV